MDNQTKELYQWVKASERLPDNNASALLFIKYEALHLGEYVKSHGTARRVNDKWLSPAIKTDESEIRNVEWLELIPSPAHTEVTDTRVWVEKSGVPEKTNSERQFISEVFFVVVANDGCRRSAYYNYEHKQWYEIETGRCLVPSCYLLPVQSPTDTPKGYTVEVVESAFDAGRNYQRGETDVYYGKPEHNYPDKKAYINSLKQI